MRGNKGFTLVELLAVLVILAIIALITTPIILGVINDARENAAADSAWAYVDAIENAYALDQASTNPGKLEYTNEPITSQVGSRDIKVSGSKTDKGTFSIDSEGTVTVSGLVFDGFTCSSSGANEMDCVPN